MPSTVGRTQTSPVLDLDNQAFAKSRPTIHTLRSKPFKYKSLIMARFSLMERPGATQVCSTLTNRSITSCWRRKIALAKILRSTPRSVRGRPFNVFFPTFFQIEEKWCHSLWMVVVTPIGGSHCTSLKEGHLTLPRR